MKPHVLIVTAHPSSKGFTHQIAKSFKEGAEAAGKTVEILDLYKTDLQMLYLNFEEPKDMANPNPVREKLQAKITAANELVFVHPLWWMGTPAIMKNFLDNVIASHYAFYYKNGWPIGMLTGKKGHVFITCDGRMWLYWLMAIPFRTIWNLGILKFCGIKPISFKVFSEKYRRTDAEKEVFLRKINKIGGVLR
jgi:NAD(P)H dehydrogenase (quinone)